MIEVIIVYVLIPGMFLAVLKAVLPVGGNTRTGNCKGCTSADCGECKTVDLGYSQTSTAPTN